jgi:pimeloyl-ACP methyl ester carboxylesterase
MKNLCFKLTLITFVLLSFINHSKSQIPPGTPIRQADINIWNAVFTFSSFGYAGCGYRLPKPLVVKDKVESDFFVLFEGGQLMGGVFEESWCLGLTGYSTRRYFENSENPTQLGDTITINFSKPRTLESFRFQTKPLTDYQITLNDSVSRTYHIGIRYPWEFPYPFKNPHFIADLGFTPQQVRNVTKLSIKSLDTDDWAFGIDNVRFDRNNGGGTPTPTPIPLVDSNPVILIPGVAASELVEVGEGSRWLPASVNPISIAADLYTLALPSNRNIYATDIFSGQFYLSGLYQADFYQNLVADFLIPKLGDLYDVAGIPERRTTVGCDMSQDSNDPALKPRVFVFAYDWRKSNVETADALKDYVGCVKRFYPNKKVDIIAHSMGGLVARRYILDNYNNHPIDKMVSIGTPWLGAPKAIHSLETGVFIIPNFGATRLESAGNMAVARGLRAVMRTFPGPMQLLPSEYYFNLNYSDYPSATSPYPFAVRRYPWSDTIDYNYSQTRNWLNEQHDILPGDITHAFHRIQHLGAQDDWQRDLTTVDYYHIYGQQRENLTVGKVRVLQNTICNPMNLNCYYTTYYEPIPTNGDGTVPLLSSRRISFSENLNTNKAKRYFVNAKNDSQQTNETTEHNKLTANSNVHATLLKILRNINSSDVLPADNDNPIPPDSAQNKLSTPVESSSFYVSMHNIEGFHASNFAQPTFGGSSGVNGMQAVPMNDKSAWIAMPATSEYKVSFFGDGTPIRVQIIKGLDYERIEQLTGYIDLMIPADAVAELIVSPFNNPQLRYDSDGDGFPDTFVNPTITVTGENAKDIEPPVVSFDYQSNGAGKIVTLSATDNLSGVRKIYYSLDGQQFTEYTNPVSVGGSQNQVFVFAEDNNYNRTGIAPIDTVGTTYSIGNRVWFDINNDGKINNNAFLHERGIDGVSVSLFADNNADGQPDDLNQPLKTTATDGEGYYRFDELNAGNYVVRVNPSNFADNAILAGFSNTTLQSSDDTDSDAAFAGENGILLGGQANNIQNVGILSEAINLGPNISEPLNETDASADDKGQFDGYANLTVDFGFYRLGLSGTVWNDRGTGTNANNGIFDDGESGLANFRVKVFQSNGGEIPVGSDGILGTSDDAVGGILTDNNGNYSFQGLAEGDYFVKIDRQSVNSSSVTSNTPNDNADFDNNGSVGSGADAQFIVSRSISLTTASRGILENSMVNEFTGITEDSTLDFGLLLSPTAASVSVQGSVNNSAGRNISRAKITLLNSATNEIKTTQTNSLGYFKFKELPVGNLYVITVQHKEYNFEPITVQPSEDINNLLITAENN